MGLEMDQPVLWWTSCCPVQHIDNIKQPIHEKHLKFCYFWKLAGSHRSHCWKGVQRSVPDSQLSRGVSASRGGLGEQAFSEGGNAAEDV